MMNGIKMRVKLYVDSSVLLDLRKLRTADILERQEVCRRKTHTHTHKPHHIHLHTLAKGSLGDIN